MNSNTNHKQQSPAAVSTDAVSHGGGAGGAAPQPKINEMIIPLLDSSAYQRLTRILMVRPERVRQVEQYVIMLAQQGQVNQKNKLTDTELKGILDGLSRTENVQNAEKKSNDGNHSNSIKNNGAFTQGITFNRRGGFMDDSDDDLDFLITNNGSGYTNANTTTTTTTTNTNTTTRNNNNNFNNYSANAADDSDDDFFD